ILMCGLCMGTWVASMPLFSRAMEQVQGQIEKQAEQARKGEMKALEAREAEAKTVEEKAEIAVRKKDLESRPKATIPGMMDYSKMGFNDARSIAWSWAEVLSGLVLNVLMLVSGIGLLHWRPWARTLAVWTAVLKVVRLVALYSFFIVALVPPVAKNL